MDRPWNNHKVHTTCYLAFARERGSTSNDDHSDRRTNLHPRVCFGYLCVAIVDLLDLYRSLSPQHIPLLYTSGTKQALCIATFILKSYHNQRNNNIIMSGEEDFRWVDRKWKHMPGKRGRKSRHVFGLCSFHRKVVLMNDGND
jgi:hypothetical protein